MSGNGFPTWENDFPRRKIRRNRLKMSGLMGKWQKLGLSVGRAALCPPAVTICKDRRARSDAPCLRQRRRVPVTIAQPFKAGYLHAMEESPEGTAEWFFRP
jgi:hypothetical protein